ncbi:MAG: hypothetical protein JWN46_1449 [Acidimicrobiales bacterium]|nr:hypothetical protein [Acidimicrobiales bacterium]
MRHQPTSGGGSPSTFVLALAAATLVLAACASNGGQQVRTGGPGGGGSVTPAAAAPGPYDEVQARYDALTAKAGPVEARGPGSVVDRVPLRQPVATRTRAGRSVRVAEARRLTITGGPFPYGDARIIVRADGVDIGEGRSGDGRRTLSVAVLDPTILHPGVVVSYQIGTHRPVVVGPLKAGG